MRQYLATGGAESPALIYDPVDKNNVVVEYDDANNGGLDYSDFEDVEEPDLTQIESEDQIKDILLNDEGFATYLTHLDDSLTKESGVDHLQPRPAVPPPVLAVPAPAPAQSGMETLEQLFQPSDTPQVCNNSNC